MLRCRDLGEFTIAGLASDQLTVKVEHRSFMTQVFRAIPSGALDLSLELSRGGSISGLVTGPDRRGQAGVQVLLMGAGKNDQKQTDRKGYFRFQGLKDGRYKVTVTRFFRRPKGSPPVDMAKEPKYDVDIVDASEEVLNVVYEY